jgi:dipeptidase E
MTRRILLISSSTLYGRGYLDHAAEEIQDFLGKTRRILFVPYALHDRDAYASRAQDRARKMGYALESVHLAPDARRAVDEADSIFIGGGNTFRLLRALYDFDLLGAIRRRVEAGIPYIGSSAGTVVACPTIKTTNDMPIIQTPSLTALGLVSFQVNAHYQDPDPDSTHMGETRETRLIQFLEENDTPVVGLREGAMVREENDATIIKGSSGARIFRKGHEPLEMGPGDSLDAVCSRSGKGAASE